MAYITFQHPSYLLFLFLIPLTIFFHFYSITSLRRNSIKFANFEAIARVKGINLYSKNLGVLFVNILIIIIITLYVSGLNLHKEMDASYFSYVIAIDSSQSMGAVDITPSRLTAAKKTSIEFIDLLPSESNIVVISFSGNTIIEQKLTKSKDLIKQVINEIELSEVGGTDVYEAILISINLLDKEENKAIILLSDGQINVGNTEEVLKVIRENDVVIHTIGIGTEEGGLAQYGISKLDEKTLQGLSYNSNGNYYRVGSGEDIKNAFKEIIKLKRKIGTVDLDIYFIITIFLLMFIQQMIVNNRGISL